MAGEMGPQEAAQLHIPIRCRAHDRWEQGLSVCDWARQYGSPDQVQVAEYYDRQAEQHDATQPERGEAARRDEMAREIAVLRRALQPFADRAMPGDSAMAKMRTKTIMVSEAELMRAWLAVNDTGYLASLYAKEDTADA